MAFPVADSYVGESGRGIFAGVPAIPAWVDSLVLNQWTELANADYSTCGKPLISPQSGFQGSDPLHALIDAYCDGTVDLDNQKFHFWGGGHADGTCNAVVSFDMFTLEWSISAQPTDPTKYPPSYYNEGNPQAGELIYPSGFDGVGFFHDDLTDPLDTPYNTTRAKASTHMYAASAVRNNGVDNEIYFFYGQPAKFDLNTNVWVDMQEFEFGSQFYAEQAEYGSEEFQQGTVAVYDDVTDKFYVTFNPGDAGGGWRSHLIRIDPVTLITEDYYSVITTGGDALGNSISMAKVGRWIYLFNKVGLYQEPQDMNNGVRFNMDTNVIEHIQTTGDLTIFTSTAGSQQETIPMFYHALSNTLRRWDYYVNAAYLYSVNLTPTSGTGTSADPYLLTQTKELMTGTAPTGTILNYQRFVSVPEWGVAMVMPSAHSNWFAIKL